MSLTQFENQNLDFKVSLIKMKRKARGEKVVDVIDSAVELTTASILDLQINESSLTMGAYGSITISNKFNILEKLNISSNSPDDIYIVISITDTELNSIDVSLDNKVITTVGLINNTAAATANIIDNVIIFDWEEAFVAAMKKTDFRIFDGQKGSEPISGGVDLIKLVEEFNNRIYKLKSQDTIVAEDSAEPNTKHNIKISRKAYASVFDVSQKILSETGVGNLGAKQEGKLPFMRFVNVVEDNEVKRKIKIDSFITSRHVDFIKSVRDNKTEGDYSDVYTEKFLLGPFTEANDADPNTSLYNKIEVYNITRADVGRLREEVWGDYKIFFPNPISSFIIDKKTFGDLQEDFIERELQNEKLDVNQPLINPKEVREMPVDLNTNSSLGEFLNSSQQLYQSVANKVFKSFLTINETISFTVKGQVYRQPNKFIWIERGQDVEEESYKKLWYVNNVCHRFAEGKYTTEIIATKIFGDTTREEIVKNKVS